MQTYDEVTSTNDVVKRAIEEGEPEGLAVGALVQTAGYGRQGRSWQSPAGGMYVSLLLRPQVPLAQLPTLSLVTGMAVRRAIARFAAPETAENVRIKWPNDVVYSVVADATTECSTLRGAEAPHLAPCAGLGVGESQLGPAAGQSGAPRPRSLTLRTTSDVSNSAPQGGTLSQDDRRAKAVPLPPQERKSFAPDRQEHGSCSANASVSLSLPFRKLAGISLESHAGGICVGIGVNVYAPEGGAAPAAGGKNVPAYVADLAERGGAAERLLPTVPAVRQAVLDAFADLYTTWCAKGFPALLSEYTAHEALAGRRVTVVNLDGDAMAEGVVQGVDEHGRLLVLPDGAAGTPPIPVSSGEAHIAFARP
ncbi:MAG: biotin--[acetyl-CoA-carboxylase] ligase [Eggerthellaceae bacterium]|nr:biotin--[acetyl-CoA-carboxylase] ligase [Eggerthellaceae bacterium]